MFWMVVGCTDLPSTRLVMCDSNLAPRNEFMALGADLIFPQNNERGGHLIGKVLAGLELAIDSALPLHLMVPCP